MTIKYFPTQLISNRSDNIRGLVLNILKFYITFIEFLNNTVENNFDALAKVRKSW